ncbi:hypothetical protein [Microcystis phage Mae-JY24]
MRLPKFLRNRRDEALVQARGNLLARAQREALSLSMSKGVHVDPVTITFTFTEQEASAMPAGLSPWFVLEGSSVKRLFGYTQFAMDGDTMRFVKRGDDELGVAVFVCYEDGRLWPNDESGTIIEMPDASPRQLQDATCSSRLAAQVVQELLSQNKGGQEAKG